MKNSFRANVQLQRVPPVGTRREIRLPLVLGIISEILHIVPGRTHCDFRWDFISSVARAIIVWATLTWL